MTEYVVKKCIFKLLICLFLTQTIQWHHLQVRVREQSKLFSELYKLVKRSTLHLPSSLSANEDPNSLNTDSNLKLSNQTQLIEILYNRLVLSLSSPSDEVVLLRSVGGVRKHWWDRDLQNLKSTSISTHRAWVLAGRPPAGDLFSTKRSAKHAYKAKLQINKNKDRK